MDQNVTVLPMAPEWFWGITALVGLALLCYLVALVLPSTPDKIPFDRFKKKLGLTALPDALVFFVGLVISALLLTAIGAAFAALFSAFSASGPSLGAGTLIIGLLGAPFLIWRTVVAQKTVDLAQENHITDLINKAVEGLGATRDMKKAALEGADKTGQVEETEANIAVRIGAILALERLAAKNLDVHIQIMEILTAYIRENARARDAKPPLRDCPDYSEDNAADYEDQLEKWKEVHTKALAGVKPRADVQMALTVIGRRSAAQKAVERADVKPHEAAALTFPDYPGEDGDIAAWLKAVTAFRRATHEWRDAPRRYVLDLRDTNLRGADFGKGDFQNARMDAADLQGAYLRDARLQGADLWEARLQGSDLRDARLQGADLGEARLQGANVWEAQLQGADLWAAQLQGADLGDARLQAANLSEAQLQKAKLWEAQLQGANLREAHLQGAFLMGAHLQGANFRAAQLDQHTSLSSATLRGAALRSVDLAKIPQIAPHLSGMFGDGTVILPGGHGPGSAAWPRHWPTHVLGDAFSIEWQKYLSDPANYTPPPPPA